MLARRPWKVITFDHDMTNRPQPAWILDFNLQDGCAWLHPWLQSLARTNQAPQTIRQRATGVYPHRQCRQSRQTGREAGQVPATPAPCGHRCRGCGPQCQQIQGSPRQTPALRALCDSGKGMREWRTCRDSEGKGVAPFVRLRVVQPNNTRGVDHGWVREHQAHAGYERLLARRPDLQA